MCWHSSASLRIWWHRCRRRFGKRNRSVICDGLLRKIKKLLILNIPYIIVGLIATNFGEAWRLAEGADSSAKTPQPFFCPSPLRSGILCRAFTHLICSLVLSAVQVYGLQYICEAKMQKNTATMLSMALPGGEPPKTLSLSWLPNLRTM